MGSTLSGLASAVRGDGPTEAGQNAPLPADRARIAKEATEAKVTEWINNKELAPKILASENSDLSFECPICFIDYAAVNETRCCNNTICTDCFAQLLIKGGNVKCPYCTETIKLKYIENSEPFATRIAAPSATSKGDTSTKVAVLSSVDARKELEAEMYAHRHMAGDLEDIEVIDRRARNTSQAARRAAHLNRVAAGQRRATSSSAGRHRSYRTIGSYLDYSSGDEEQNSIPRRQRETLPYLRSRGGQTAASVQEAAPLTRSTTHSEWHALHNILAGARHQEIDINDEDLSRLEERMLTQALRQSLIDSGGPIVENTSQNDAPEPLVRTSPAELAHESNPGSGVVRLSEQSVASESDMDEEALLELALAMSLADADDTAAVDQSFGEASS